MKFMCDEMSKGLLAGKKYGSAIKNFEYIIGIYGGVLARDMYSFFVLNTDVINADRVEFYDHPLSFSEAVVELKKGNMIEDDHDKAECKYEDGNTNEHCSFGTVRWIPTEIGVADVMGLKWRVVNV